MGLVLITAPTLEPLTAYEAKRHLRLDTTTAEPVPPAPTVALAGAGAGNVNNGVHRYRVTFVTADGETDGGDISAAVTVADSSTNGRVSITGIPIGGGRVTQRKIYRTVAGGSTYLLLTTIADNTTTTYQDNTADASLGAQVPTSNATEDPEVLSFVAAARLVVEEETGRALVTQTWEYTLDKFPFDDEAIRLPKPPLVSVSSVKYLDLSGNEQTMSASDYVVDTGKQRGEIVLAADKSWPIALEQRNAIKVRFVAGYGAPAAVPGPLVSALKLVLGDLHGNRSAGIVGATFSVNPAVDRILNAYRVLEVA